MRYGWMAAPALLATLLLDSALPAAAQEETVRLPPRAEVSRVEDTLGPLTVRVPRALSVNEEQPLRVTVEVSGARSPLRLFAEGLPPGARWDEPSRTLTFLPDFTQGGWSGEVIFTATDGQATEQARMRLTVNDTVRPPPPRLLQVEELPGCVRLTLEQRTDRWLDSPGYAGRTFSAVVTVPLTASAAAPLPVTVRLHGVGHWPPEVEVSADRFLIEPSDP
ncbi:MAG TPA: hypothetical protein VMK65_09540, partial [Longimicrobiales bacterium]|nr:hypothetical protein [Longimicrobiales bacterium]